jgi:hypothetical protein
MSKKPDEAPVVDPIFDMSSKSSRSTVAILDALMQRGAFKGEEAMAVGQLREQCIQIIQHVESQAQDNAAA